jgi:hypothetical protein
VTPVFKPNHEGEALARDWGLLVQLREPRGAQQCLSTVGLSPRSPARQLPELWRAGCQAVMRCTAQDGFPPLRKGALPCKPSPRFEFSFLKTPIVVYFKYIRASLKNWDSTKRRDLVFV